MSTIRLVQPRHPDWTVDDQQKFDLHYDLLCTASYPLHDGKPLKKFYGTGTERRCAFCGGAAPQVSFKKDAHALPAALGNRRLFTLEECDTCNEGFSEWEENLSDMLMAQRIMGRIPSRKGYPRLSPKRAASIEAASPRELRIGRDESDNSVVLQFHGEGEASLSLACPAFSPVKAGLALLHSLWLVLPTGHRVSAVWPLTVIRSVALTGCQLFRFTQVGSPLANVLLSAWARKSGSALASSDFIVQLEIFDTVLVLAGPNSAGASLPTLLPPFHSSGAGEVKAVQYLLKTPSDRVDSARVTYYLGFDSRTRGEVTGPARQPPPSNRHQGRPVFIETGDGTAQARLRTKLFIDSWEVDERKLRLQGGQLPGKFAVSLGGEGKRGTFTVQIFPHSMKAKDMLPALELIDRLRQTRHVRIRLEEDDRLVFESSLGPEEFPLIASEKVLRDLALIEEKTGIDVRYPKEVSEEFLETLAYAARAVGSGQVEQGSGSVSATYLRSEAERLQAALSGSVESGSNRTLRIEGTHESIVLDGKEVVLGPFVDSFEFTEVLVGNSDVAGPEGTAAYTEVTFRVKKGTRTFERWLPHRRNEDPTVA